MESKTLIHNDEIIAFKQTGAGSECDNVIEIGNIDDGIFSLDNVLDKDENISSREIEEVKQKVYKLR